MSLEKPKIRVLRTGKESETNIYKSISDIDQSLTLNDGQPLYDSKNKKLYIGHLKEDSSTTKISDLSNICDHANISEYSDNISSLITINTPDNEVSFSVNEEPNKQTYSKVINNVNNSLISKISNNNTGSIKAASTLNIWKSFYSNIVIYGKNVWSDGVNTYYSNFSDQYVLNLKDDNNVIWEQKTWTGLTSFYGEDVWSDGNNIYQSRVSSQYILNKVTGVWSPYTWNGIEEKDFENFYGRDVWSDGNNIYLSSKSTQYILNKNTNTWTKKTWTGLTSFYGEDVWSDKNNIYYSRSFISSEQYMLNIKTSTWETVKNWAGISDFSGSNIWTDGNNIYLSFIDSYHRVEKNYILDKNRKLWTEVIFHYPDFMILSNLSKWTDGRYIYCSKTNSQQEGKFYLYRLEQSLISYVNIN